MGFPGGAVAKNLPANAGDIRDWGPSSVGNIPGEGNGNPLQYFSLKNPRGQRGLAGYSPWGPKELDMIEAIQGEGNGTPLQYCCLENPMDGGAWWAAVRGVAKGRTQLSDFPFTFHFHALEKEMATHSSVLACRIPGTEKPGRLQFMGSHRVGHDRSDLAAAAAEATQHACMHACTHTCRKNARPPKAMDGRRTLKPQ